jgi:hypothetical protein
MTIALNLEIEGTTMEFMENNPRFVTNIMSFPLQNFENENHNKLKLLVFGFEHLMF